MCRTGNLAHVECHGSGKRRLVHEEVGGAAFLHNVRIRIIAKLVHGRVIAGPGGDAAAAQVFRHGDHQTVDARPRDGLKTQGIGEIAAGILHLNRPDLAADAGVRERRVDIGHQIRDGDVGRRSGSCPIRVRRRHDHRMVHAIDLDIELGVAGKLAIGRRGIIQQPQHRIGGIRWQGRHAQLAGHAGSARDGHAAGVRRAGRLRRRRGVEDDAPALMRCNHVRLQHAHVQGIPRGVPGRQRHHVAVQAYRHHRARGNISGRNGRVDGIRHGGLQICPERGQNAVTSSSRQRNLNRIGDTLNLHLEGLIPRHQRVEINRRGIRAEPQRDGPTAQLAMKCHVQRRLHVGGQIGNGFVGSSSSRRDRDGLARLRAS